MPSTSGTSRVLDVSKALALPLAYVTQRNAVLAMSGAGKSNLCVVLAEEMYRCGVPWIAIDPKGDWWGVRAAAEGKGRGLDVPIIGGEHGDLPLSPRSGARMAELVTGGKLQGVFDVSGFDSDELSTFMIDFGTGLLRGLRTPLHVFCEECSDYLPQPGSSGRLDKLAAECLKVWKKASTQGRFRGLGYTLISQRAAMVNKSALYQCETLIAMRVVGEHDKKAVRTWIEQQADATGIMKTLPLLEDGEAWVCSPQKLKLMQRVRFRRRTTYDSGRTPEIGEAFVAPKLSTIDVGSLRAEMEAFDAPPARVIDAQFPEVDEDELLALREEWHQRGLRIDELERALEKPAINEAMVDRLERAAKTLHESGIAAVEASRDLMAALPSGREVLPNSAQEVVHRDAKPAKSNGKAVGGFSPELPGASQPTPAAARKLKNLADGGKLAKGDRVVLVAIAQHRDGVTREQLSVLTGYKRSSRDTYVQHLRQDGLVVEKGLRIEATPAGRKALGSDWQPLPTGAKLRSHWLERLPAGERAVLEVLVAAHPRCVSREAVDKATGYKRSSRDTYIQKLGARRLLVAAGSGGVKASDELF